MLEKEVEDTSKLLGLLDSKYPLMIEVAVVEGGMEKGFKEIENILKIEESKVLYSNFIINVIKEQLKLNV